MIVDISVLVNCRLKILKKSKFINDEINIIKNVALEKLHRQKCLEDSFALLLLE